MSSATLDRFLNLAPCSVLARTALEHLFEPKRLDELFGRHAERQYLRELFFSDLLHLVLQVVLQTKPSLHAAFQAAELPVTHQAVYDKLKRLEPGLCEVLVDDSATQVRATITELKAGRDEPIAGLRMRVLDGNLLASTQRRLQPLRQTWAKGLPGRVLVVYEPSVDLVTHAVLEPDAHASERSRIEEVWDLAQANDLWVMDSHFCNHQTFQELASVGAYFVVRHHGAMKGRGVGERREVGRTETGRVFEQSWELQGANAGWVIRRLSLVLDQPTRDGDPEIHVLTNVPADRADAVVVLEVYRDRWKIEDRFYELAQTLNAEPGTLSHPLAALFAFSLGLVASNAMALMRASLRAVHGSEAVEGMSRERMANEIRETYRGMMIALPPEVWAAARLRSPASLADRLREIAHHVQPSRYRKAKRGPKKPPTRKTPYKNGATASTYRLLQHEHREP